MIVLTTEQAAGRVGVATSTIRTWVERGYLAPLRPGARPLVFRETDVVTADVERMSEAAHAELDLMRELLERSEG